MSQNFSPSYTTAMLLLRQLADRPDLLTGVSAQNLKILSQPYFWTVSQRSVYRQAMESVLFESLDFLAMPRHKIVVEYVAACIVCFVSPCNFLQACSWSEWHGQDADSMSLQTADTAEYEPYTARQLHAVVLNCYGGCPDVIGPSTFQARMDAAIAARLAPDVSQLQLEDVTGQPKKS